MRLSTRIWSWLHLLVGVLAALDAMVLDLFGNGESAAAVMAYEACHGSIPIRR